VNGDLIEVTEISDAYVDVTLRLVAYGWRAALWRFLSISLVSWFLVRDYAGPNSIFLRGEDEEYFQKRFF